MAEDKVVFRHVEYTENAEGTMIEIHGLQKSFGTNCVLENINLTVQDGDIYGLVGVSGAGKSTLLRCINGMETYDSGSLKVDSVEIRTLDKGNLRQFRKGVSMIFQHFPMLQRKTVYDNIAFPMRCWHYSKTEIDTKVRKLAEIVGITDKLTQKPRELSGGQKQRVAIARALTMEPKLLLSDESTSALDPITTKSILQLLRKINEELGITIVLVTHQMSVVREVCNHAAMLQRGQIIVEGEVEDIFLHQPSALKHFLGEEEVIPPDDGFYLQIMLLDEDSSKSILSSLAQELHVTFSIMGGKMERYRDKHLGSLIVSFPQSDREKVKHYLDQRHIIWHELQPEQTGGQTI